MNEVNTVVKALSLSIKSQQHFASMVDYNRGKLKRFDRSTQQLYLLCYLQKRAEQNSGRLAEVFVYHASADRQKFESRLATFKTRCSSKYFGTNKDVSGVTFIENHAALNAKVIGSNERESHHIFNLLQSNIPEIQPDVLSTEMGLTM